MDLIRDLLDKKVVDRNGREMGRVDTIVLAVRDDGPPRVTAIELGAGVLAYRVHPVCGKWMAALEYVLGLATERPVRIGIGDVLSVDDHVKVDLAIGETGAAAIEQRVRRWLRGVPGAS